MLIDGNASAWTPGLAGTAKIIKGKHMPDSPRPRSALVPHDLAAPIPGVVSGPLAGLMAVVKDMYDMPVKCREMSRKLGCSACSEFYGGYMPISPIWVMRSIKEKESLQIVAKAGQAMPIMELTSSRNSAFDIRAAGGFAIAGKCIFIYPSDHSGLRTMEERGRPLAI